MTAHLNSRDQLAPVIDLSRLGLVGGHGPVLDSGPALTAEDAAHELVTDGCTLAQARTVVGRYLDDASAELGTSVHRWGLDQADLDAMRADPLIRARDAVTAVPADLDDDHHDAARVGQYAAQNAGVDEDGWGWAL